MFLYIIKKIISIIPVLFAVSTIVFFLIHAIPGDPVDLILGERALAADRSALVHELKLDRPMGEQYIGFLKGVVTGRLGTSIYDGETVAGHISSRYSATLTLACFAMFFAVVFAIPVGVVSALKRDKLFDRFAMSLALMGISIPNFWLAPVLILIFSVHLRWFPIAGRDSLSSIILPAIVLGFGLSAMLSRLTRASMLDELKKEYVVAARAKGLSEKRVIMKHALKNALNPVITILGLQIGSLFAGTIITEKIFNWPGIGSLLMDSIMRRDYPVVQGVILVISFAYVIINAITDCLYRVADPRVKL